MSSLASHSSDPRWNNNNNNNNNRGNPFLNNSRTTSQSERNFRSPSNSTRDNPFTSMSSSRASQNNISSNMSNNTASLKDFSANEHYQEQLIKCKTGVMVVNRKILATQKIVENIGTRKDSYEMREKLNEVFASIKTLITNTEKLDKDMSNMEKKLKKTANSGQERIDKSQIVSRKKLIADLKKEKKLLTSLEKKARVKLRQFPPPSPINGGRSSTSSSFDNDSFKLSSANSSFKSNDPGSLKHSRDGSISDINKAGVFLSRDAMERRLQEQMIVEGELEVNEALIRERQEAMLEINKELGKVNEIFQDLASLVEEQHESIEDISENIIVTHEAAERGLAELKQAEENQRKSTCVIS